jgi:PAS domain S-box-containing protein
VVWNGVILDITDRKHAELALLENDERHRSLIAALAEGIVVINPDGTVREANRAAEQIFARMKDEMSERGNDESLVKIRDESGKILSMKEWPAVYTFETGKPVTDATMFITTPERPEGFWLSCNTQPMVRHGERKPFAVVATLRDITEQRRIEAERRQLEAELQQAQRIETVGELAGGIAHDFNNLLTAIFSYTENAKSHLTADDAAYQSILKAEKVAHEARTITTSLLTFCRKNTSVREPVRINEAIAESIRMVSHMRKHNVDIQTHLDRTETLFVMADPTQLRQMLINLMINAIDAMPHGGTLAIRGASQTTDDGGLNVKIALTDTGAGIAEGDLHRIFEPFFTTRPRGRGTGLGLAIVHGIVRAMSGTIDVKSTLGSGTTMTVELPAFHRGTNHTPARVQRGDGSVLLMTQDAFVHNMVRSWLKRDGFKAVAVRSLDEMPQVKTCAVIVDVGDADNDTVVLCRDIHQRAGHAPIVLLGNAADIDELSGKIDVHILRKPYKMAELIELVRRITTSVRGGDI